MTSTFSKSTEKADFNQYWYSEKSIAALTSAAIQLASQGAAPGAPPRRVAFLSTPSLYFSLPAPARAPHVVLDLDEQWSADPGFHRFDFNEGAAGVPAALRGAFDAVAIDPPFITAAVWEKYAEAARALLREGGRVLCTTVAENEGLLAGLFPGCRAAPFQPSIPRLVYQYNCFCGGEVPAAIAGLNPEIP